MKRFEEIFSRYLEGEKLPVLEQAPVAELSLSADRERMMARLEPEGIIPKEEIYRAEDRLRRSLGLRDFIIQARFDSRLLDGSYLPNITTELIEEGEPINGFFSGAQAVWKDGLFFH